MECFLVCCCIVKLFPHSLLMCHPTTSLHQVEDVRRATLHPARPDNRTGDSSFSKWAFVHSNTNFYKMNHNNTVTSRDKQKRSLQDRQDTGECMTGQTCRYQGPVCTILRIILKIKMFVHIDVFSVYSSSLQTSNTILLFISKQMSKRRRFGDCPCSWWRLQEEERQGYEGLAILTLSLSWDAWTYPRLATVNLMLSIGV